MSWRLRFLPVWFVTVSKLKQRKCLCCNQLFSPNKHNKRRQVFCSTPDCRKASKSASQDRWLNKPPNRSYFRGSPNTQRVQQWRKDHPNYWKRSKTLKTPQTPSQSALSHPPPTTTIPCNVPSRDLIALQDLVLTQHPAFVGLISLVTGSTLQEDIATVSRNLLIQGQNILGITPLDKNSNTYDSQTTHPP